MFIDELINRGLKCSQVDKVWRMYADRDFILRHGVKGMVGMEYVIDYAHMPAMAGELGIHGTCRGKSGTWRLAQLVRRAGCFLTWVEVNDDDNDNQLLQFASPLYKSDDTLQNG